MNCPRCQTALPNEAAFCSRCGLALSQRPVAPTPTGPTPLPVSPNPRKQWLWVAGPFLALGLVAAILFASGILFKSPSVASSDILRNDPTPASPELLRVQPKQGGDMTAQPVPDAPVPMPEHIRKWLEHLNQTEQRRNRLANQHLGEFTAALFELQGAGIKDVLEQVMSDMSGGGEADDTIKPPAKDLAEDYAKARGEWTSLTDFFNSFPPPSECVAISNSYEVALRETAASVSNLISILEEASSGQADTRSLVGKLQGMKGGSKHIDEAGRNTDRLVQEICDQYNTRKWFDVAGDIGDAGILGRF